MYYNSRKIRTWPIAMIALLFTGFIIAKSSLFQHVAAHAQLQSIELQSVEQNSFNFSHALVRFTPLQDSCGDRIELELTNGAVDIDITIYDELIEIGEQRFNPSDRLTQILDRFSTVDGSTSFQLSNPLRLTEGDDVYIAVSALSPVLAANTATSDADSAYISYDGSTWRESALAFNIQLQTSDCGADVPAGPAATNTPFVPTPTATPPPTATPVPTTAPDQPTNTPTATVAAQIVCEAPPIHLRSAAASFVEEQQSTDSLLDQESLVLGHFSPEQFSNPSASKDALLEFYLAHAPELLQPFEDGQQPLAPIQVNLPAQVAPNTIGSVLLPDGTPAQFYTIYIYETDSQGNVSGEPVVVSQTDENGVLGLYLLSGSYLLRVEPPVKDAAGLPVDGIQTLERLFEVGPDMVDLGQLTLPATSKVIQGQLVHTDGTQISEARVDAINVNTGQYVYTYPDNNGNFTLNVGGGSWQVSLLPALGVNWIAVDLRQNVQFASDENAETIDDLVFTVRPADAVMRGQITDPSGQPLTSDSLEVFGLNFNARFDLFDTVTERFAYGFVDASGQFTIPLASGIYEGNVWIDNEFYPQFMGNFLEDIVQVTTGVVNVGQIRALANTSTLRGVVSNSDGELVPNVAINLWRESGLQRSALTDENGLYEMTVPSGNWWIRPEPQTYQAQLFIGDSQQVSVDVTAPTQLDFSLEPSAGILAGTVVDAQDSLLSDVSGYAYIRRSGNNRPAISVAVENGRFSTKVPYGDLQVGMFFGPESLYVLPEEAVPENSSGASADFSVQLEVLAANAQVQGQLRERDGTPVTGITGDVVAIEQGRPQNWKRSTINPTDGSYSLNLIPGTWDLVYELALNEDDNTILPNSESPIAVIAEADTTVTQNLPVTTLVEVARGTVVDENDRPIPNALVMILADNFEGSVRSDANGLFTAYLPSDVEAAVEAASIDGSRRSASRGSAPRGSSSNRRPRQATQLPELPSPISVVEVDDALGEVGEMRVVLRYANAYLTGQVLDLNQQPVGGVKVSGVNPQDAQEFTVVTEDNGCFTAPIKLEGAYEWEITTRYQDGDGVMMESQFTMTGDETAAANLQAASVRPQAITNLPVDSGIAMEYRGIIPQQEVHTFSVDSGWGYTMPDGFTIQIPPNAINTTESEVRIQLIPEFMLNDTYLHRVVGYGYRITLNDSNGRAILSEFRSNVQLTFNYQEDGVADAEGLIVAHRANDQWLEERRVVQNQTDSSFSVSIGKPGVYAVVQSNPIPELDENVPLSSTEPASLTGGVEANATRIADGAPAVWTILVNNEGAESAEGVVLIAQLPSGTEITESSLAAGWTARDASTYSFALDTLAGGASVSTDFAVTLLANSGLTTILEPRVLLQSDVSEDGINISTGLGNNIDVDRVPTASPEDDEADAIEYQTYLPVVAR